MVGVGSAGKLNPSDGSVATILQKDFYSVIAAFLGAFGSQDFLLFVEIAFRCWEGLSRLPCKGFRQTRWSGI